MNSFRLVKEFKDIKDNSFSDLPISVGLPDENNIHKWRVTLMAPEDSNYKGGIFQLEIIFPKEYPDSSPEIHFITPIYHLDVNPRNSQYEPLGHVSSSITNWWKPATTAREMLTKLFAVFYWQEPDSPYGLDMMYEYRENKELYECKVRYFTKKYALPNSEWKYEDKDWDFSVDEKNLNSMAVKPKEKKIESKKYDENEIITLYFSINGIEEKTFECKLYELTENVMKKFMDKNGIKQDENILFIFNMKRLKLDAQIGDNGLKNNSRITVIYDVIFA